MAKGTTVSLSIEYDQASGQATVTGIKKVEKSLDELKKSGDSVGSAGSEGLREIGNTAEDTGAMLAKVGQGLIVLGLVETLRQIGTAALHAGVESEQLKTRLTQMEGSAEAAERRLRALDVTSSQLGMGLRETTDAFALLKDLGLDPSARALEAYANIASAKSKSISQWVEAVADATTGEFERLKEFGIKAGIEGDKLTLRFKGQTTSINNDAKSIEEALVKIGETEYAGAAAAQARTTGAAISQLADATDRLLAKWGKDSGLVAVTGELARGLTDVMRALEQTSTRQEQTNVAVQGGVKAFNAALNPLQFLAKESLNAAGGLEGLLGKTADVIRDMRGVDQSAQLAADATAEYAEGIRNVNTAIGPLTEQQAMLVDQTLAMAAADNAAADAKKALGQAAKVTSDALTDATTILGTDVTALETGIAVADRKIVEAFTNIATNANMSGEAISNAYSIALGKVTKDAIPALLAAWTRARVEGQITSQQFAAGASVMEEAMARVGRATTTAITQQKKAADDTAKAIEKVAAAAKAVQEAQDKTRGGADSNNWANASVAATKTAQEIDSGRPVQALESIENALNMLERAAQSGDTSAGLELTKRQLIELAAEAEKALTGVSKVLGDGSKAKDKDGKATSTKDAAFKDPIPLTFDVTAGAAAAGAQVVAAIQAALAGASFSVPVTAVVTVDAGGATPTGAGGTTDVARASAKTGTRPL